MSFVCSQVPPPESRYTIQINGTVDDFVRLRGALQIRRDTGPHCSDGPQETRCPACQLLGYLNSAMFMPPAPTRHHRSVYTRPE